MESRQGGRQRRQGDVRSAAARRTAVQVHADDRGRPSAGGHGGRARRRPPHARQGRRGAGETAYVNADGHRVPATRSPIRRRWRRTTRMPLA